MQHTLKDQVTFKGVGLHSGEPVTMIVSPALANQGIKFIRQDITDTDNVIPAQWDMVEASQLCTRVKNEAGVSVSTIEHIMAAFSGLGIDNAIVILDDAEVPIMDGSSMPFIEKFKVVGLQKLDAPRKAVRILKTVEIKDDQGRIARFEPDVSSVFEFTIDFDNDMIRRQTHVFDLAGDKTFQNELANCRTFTRMQDVTMLQQAGLIKGGGLDNAVVYDNDRVLNPEGLRRSDEAVRHKLLDAIGDIYLLGMPVIGRFVCEKGGHALTNQLLHKLMSDPRQYVIIEDHLGIGTSSSDLNVSSTSKLAYNA